MIDITSIDKESIDDEYERTQAHTRILEEFVLKYYDYIHRYENYGSEEEEHTLSMMEITTLTMIEENPGITVTELAKKWEKTTSAVSQTVTRLEQYKYVDKIRGKKNVKKIHIYATKLGEKLSYQHKILGIKNINQKETALVEKSSREKLDEFYDMIKIYTGILERL